MKLDHLEFPDIGWGYMPAQEDVYSAFRFVQKRFKPKSVLEIGFHIGHSTTYQLEIYEQAKIVAVSPDNEKIGKTDDQIDPQQRRDVAERIASLYPGRFEWLRGRTKDVVNDLDSYWFDFALIDGNHSYRHAKYDADVCRDLVIPHALVDNWDQTAVRQAINDSGYKFVKRFFYEQTFKGKTNTNQIALVSLDIRFNV